jgi:hypothetical protein
MTRTKLGLLGFCAMMFGLMAFSATGAQAEVGAKWLLAEKVGTNLIPFLPATVNLKVDKDASGNNIPFVLHSEILKIKTLFKCTEIKAVKAVLLAEGNIGEGVGAVKGSKILFNNCVTELNGAVATECKPETEGVSGEIVTNPGHGEIVLHELTGGVKDDLTEIIPDTGLNTTFVTIKLPVACPIGTSVPVIGKFFLKDCKDLALTHLVEHLVEEGPLSELFTISKTTEHAAKLLGSAWAFLTGEHEGLKWSGDPA